MVMVGRGGERRDRGLKNIGFKVQLGFINKIVKRSVKKHSFVMKMKNPNKRESNNTKILSNGENDPMHLLVYV